MEPSALRQRVIATLHIILEAIEAGTLAPVSLSVNNQSDAKTGKLTGQQTLELTTRPNDGR